ncbi:flippase-like domain-containing protein [bacterium]|nr:flippase-like domain-containing protein [bacterium]
MTIPGTAQNFSQAFEKPQTATENEKIPKHRRWLWISLRIILTIVVVGLLFWQIPWRNVFAIATGMKGFPLFGALLLWIPAHAFQFERLAVLAKHAGKEATWRDIFRSYWVGFTLGVITPGRIGQFGRCFALNVPVARAVGVSLIERFYATVVINGAGPWALLAMISSGVFVLPIGGWRTPLLVGLGLV